MKKDQIYVKPHPDGMAIYVLSGGAEYFVTTRRRNYGLYHYLEGGRTADEVKRYRPSRSKRQQKLRHSLDYIAKVADCVLGEVA